jgi:hypothetical protein
MRSESRDQFEVIVVGGGLLDLLQRLYSGAPAAVYWFAIAGTTETPPPWPCMDI